MAANQSVSAFHTTRDEDYFPDPTAFQPSRWLQGKKPSPFASTPFGGGVHRCIGAALAALEAQVVLHALARGSTRLCKAPGRRDRQVSFSGVLVPDRGGRVIGGARPRAVGCIT